MVVAEAHLHPLQLALPFHIDLLMAVHQNVAYGGVGQKGLQGPQAQDLVFYLVHQGLALALV